MGGNLSLNMPQFFEIERERAKCIFMGGAPHNTVVRHFNLHRILVERLVTRLKETRLTGDRPYSGKPRVTTPYQGREITLTHIQNRFRSIEQTARTIYGRHYPRIRTKTV